MLCASAKALLPWLSAGSDLWQSVDFVAQASPARPLAVHLLQFAAWASERKAHLRSLTIRCIPPAVAGEAVSINRWSLKELAHADLPALEFLLGALAGAPRLVELRLDVHALPHCEWGRFYSPSLPALETLALSFPLLGLEALSLALLPRLRTLSLDGVQLCPSTLLPHSLTALEGRSARIDNWNSVDSVVGMPCCAPGLRSLSIKGGSDEQGQRSLCLCGLGQLTTLTSLSIDGPKLTVGDEEDEDEEEWEEEEGEQKEGPLQEMAHLRSLERLRLDSVSGLAIEGQPLSMPHWPELKVSRALVQMHNCSIRSKARAAIQLHI